MPRMHTIILDTLGKLYAHGHGLVGWCLDCAGRYRLATPATEQVRSSFDVNISAFIAERGADAAIIGLGNPDNVFTASTLVPGEQAAGTVEETGCKMTHPAA